MEKFGSYKILNKERLIIEYHSGEINVDDFITARKIISSDSEYNPNFDVVFDFRNATTIVKQQDIDKFYKFFITFIPVLGKRKSGYLTENPNEVVITTLFSMKLQDSLIQSDTFSTIKGIVSWINNTQINEQILTEIIDELKLQTNTLYSNNFENMKFMELNLDETTLMCDR